MRFSPRQDFAQNTFELCPTNTAKIGNRYQRFDTEAVFELLLKLYRGPLRLYINFFQSSEKCIEKKRIGSKIKKVYDVAQTPYQRVVAHPKVSQDTKETLTRLFENLNPFKLRKEIDMLVREIQKQSKWHL